MNETDNNNNLFRRCSNKLFFGINMSWVKVIIFAVATAVVTAIFLILPIFNNTSFREMGTMFEAWIFFAIIIMTNCKKPLESALKTFVFFLISQPLIYLIQVPFSEMGWSLFMYYKTWFFWTLLTFPMAFAGWYLKKGNWLSLLILTPINILLAYIGWSFLTGILIYDFPSHLISVLFCFGQIALYLAVFFKGRKYRLAGGGVVIAALIVMTVMYLTGGGMETGVKMPLPDEPKFSENAVVSFDDSSFGEATITIPEEGYVDVKVKKQGSAVMTITDNGKEYKYDVKTVRSDGHTHVEITPKQ